MTEVTNCASVNCKYNKDYKCIKSGVKNNEHGECLDFKGRHGSN